MNAKNADEKTDIFYFSGRGYSRPTNDLGNNWFWSSSVSSSNSGSAYVLYGYDGYVYAYGTRYNLIAVRCVRGQ